VGTVRFQYLPKHDTVNATLPLLVNIGITLISSIVKMSGKYVAAVVSEKG